MYVFEDWLGRVGGRGKKKKRKKKGKKKLAKAGIVRSVCLSLGGMVLIVNFFVLTTKK